MKTQKWIRITRCENIPIREGRAVKIGDLDVAVFNLGDRFLAVHSRCPHNGGPLADGIVSGKTVVCPLHAWKVDLESGVVTKPADTSACLRTFPTRVEEGVVLLDASPLCASAQETSDGVEIVCHSAAVAVSQPVLEPVNRL